MNIKRLLIVFAACLSLISIAGLASAAPTMNSDVAIYGASAQFNFWTAQAPAYLSAAGCTGVSTAVFNSGSSSENGKHSIAMGTCGGTVRYFRVSSKASYDGPLAMGGNTTHPNATLTCGTDSTGKYQRMMIDEATCTNGTCTGLKCVTVTGGASDVMVSSFKQQSSGLLLGPNTGSTATVSRDFGLNPVPTPSGTTDCRDMVVPFAYYIAKTVEGGDAITAVKVTAAGTGYTSKPTVNMSGGAGSGAAAVVNGMKILTINVDNGGSNYTAAPIVSFTGGVGSGAAATAHVTTGVVDYITVTANGAGYDPSSPVTVVLTNAVGDTTGAGAAASVATYGVQSVSVTAGGTGYTASYNIGGFTGGSGSGATATAYRTINNLTSSDAKLLFSGKIIYWSDLGFDNHPVAVCARHAGSGTHASIDLTQMKPASLKTGESTSTTSTDPIYYFNDGASDLMKCLNNNWSSTPYAVGYADADQSLVSYPNVIQTTLNGLAATADNIRHGYYDFWTTQNLYYKNTNTDMANVCNYFKLCNNNVNKTWYNTTTQMYFTKSLDSGYMVRNTPKCDDSCNPINGYTTSDCQ